MFFFSAPISVVTRKFTTTPTNIIITTTMTMIIIIVPKIKSKMKGFKVRKEKLKLKVSGNENTEKDVRVFWEKNLSTNILHHYIGPYFASAMSSVLIGCVLLCYKYEFLW